MDIDSPAPPASPAQQPPADQVPTAAVTSQAAHSSPGAQAPSSTAGAASTHASPIPSASAADAAPSGVDAPPADAASATEAGPSEQPNQQQPQAPHASLANLTEARDRGATPSSTASEHVATAPTPTANGHDAMDITENGEEAGDHDATSSSSGSCPMSSVASGAATIDVTVANPEDSAEDMDRFIKRMEMEKVSQPVCGVRGYT